MCIEAVKLHGKNRHDALNRLKPCISNDVVEEHAKPRDPRQVPNVTNHLHFTNFDDALPLDAGGRRYFDLCAPFWHRRRAAACRVGDIHAYFDALMDEAVSAEAGALRQWLLSWPIRATFSPNMRAR